MVAQWEECDMTSRAAQVAFKIMKEDWFEGPMDSMDRPMPSMRPEMVNGAKQLFLGTITAFLEQGQEDYVAMNLPEASPQEIEAGRDMALKALSALDMG